MIKKLKETDSLFEALYETKFYGGSFYDGLKISKPNEYDLDLLLRLPRDIKPILIPSSEPGFVHMHFQNLEALNKQPTLRNKYK